MEQLANLNTAEALAALDAASGDHPVLLRDETYHNRWANSAALRAAGIGKDTPNPNQGEIGHDPKTGALTGVLIEFASSLVDRALANPATTPRKWTAPRSPSRSRCSIPLASPRFSTRPACSRSWPRSSSSTTVASSPPGRLRRCRRSSRPGCTGSPATNCSRCVRRIAAPHVKPDFAKIFLDGVPGAKTAAFHELYTPDPIRGCCFRGATLMTVPDLVRWLGKCEKQGLR